jgi:Tfp pilus assembly protein PilF
MKAGQREFEDAMDLFRQSLAGTFPAPRYQSEAVLTDVLCNIGLFSLKLGDFGQAIRVFAQVRKVKAEILEAR